MSGKCNCKPGWTGQDCSRPCPINTFGEDCSKECSCENEALCDPVNGRCICSAGKYGVLIVYILYDQVVQIYFSDYICIYYSRCVLNSKTLISGFLGENCQESCSTGKYGQGCLQECKCVHATGCSPDHGHCACEPGIT